MQTHAQQRTGADQTDAAASTLADDVERALHDLPSAELAVLRGRFAIGARRHSRRELARRLGLSLSNVRRLERLALRDLRALALPSDVPRRRPLAGAPTVGRSGEANRPAPPGRSRPPLPRPL